MIAAEIAPRAAKHDVEETFVSDGYQLLKEAGFFKACVPAEFGGGGAGVADICGVIRRSGAGLRIDGARLLDAHAPGGDGGVALEAPECAADETC